MEGIAQAVPLFVWAARPARTVTSIAFLRRFDGLTIAEEALNGPL
jgi:hypothetical protein